MPERARRRALEAALVALARTPAEPRLAAAFRVAFGLLATAMAIRCLPLADFLWWHRPPLAALAPLLHGSWPLLALLVTVGLGGRLALGAHFLVATAVLGSEITGPSIEETLFGITSFWLLFLGTGAWSLDAAMRRRFGKPVTPVPGWPLAWLGINLGLLFVLAGVTKVFDPLWRYGDGFYYVFLLSWIKDGDVADALLGSRPLMTVLNHLSIVFELAFLPAFLVPRLRAAAVVAGAGFFALLTWPFQLGFIGPLGLALTLGLAAVSPLRPARRPAPAGRATRLALPLALLAFMVFFFANSLGMYRLRYPLIFPPLAAIEADGTVLPRGLHDNLLRQAGHALPALAPALEAAATANAYSTRILPLVLFSSVHTVGIYVYRLEARLADGRVVEPLRLVDRAMSPAADSAGLEPRFLQLTMYWMGSIAQRWAADPAFTLDPRDRTRVDAVMTFARHRLEAGGHHGVEHMTVLIRPIAVPDTWAGRAELGTVDWRPLVRYRPADGTLALIERPPPFPSRPRIGGLGPGARLEVRP